MPGSSIALAGNVTVTPRIEVRETYTDNVLLTPTNERNDFVSVVVPGINVRLEGPKLNGFVDYEASVLYFARRDDSQIRHDLNTNLRYEAVNNFFFIDTSAAIREQFINRNGAFSFSDDNVSGNRSTIQTYNISPFFQGQIGQIANWEVRYRYGIVLAEQRGPTPIDPAQAFTDSRDHSASVRLFSGPQFRTITWSASGNLRRSSVNGPGRGFRDEQLRFDLGYRVSRIFSINGGLGYQRINLLGLTRDGDGIVWDVGFNLNPSRRTTFSARYGKRIRQDVVSANLSYRVNSALSINGSYSDTFQSNQTLLTGQLPGLVLGDDGIPRGPDGFPLPVDQPGFDLNNQNFRQQRGTLGLNYQRNRMRVALFGAYEKRTFSRTEPSEDAYSANLNITRQFSRRSSGVVRLTYRFDDFRGITRTDDLFGATVRYTYNLTRRLTGTLSYVRTQRASTNNNFDLTENAVSIGLQATF